ncbi:type-F conjugative transfer system pilin assembly protein TrbC [Xanthomonas arboricola]|nr:type-F conjugative transfer system pilin assembly protein TrbC [Xanthomonas arboricola]
MHGLCIVAVFIGARPVAAQQAEITDADIARVQREQPTITDDDIRRAQQRHVLPPERLPAPSGAPNLGALPVPATTAPLDLGAVAEGYRQQIQAPTPSLDNGPALYLFVSLSMPEPTLRRLLAQAAQARATVLVRGLSDGSLRKTAARLQALIGDAPVSIQIDPRLFDQFAVRRVPTFVLTRTAANTECTGGTCQSDPAFLRTSGDVSLDYALAYMQRSAPAWSGVAALYLQRLERPE